MLTQESLEKTASIERLEGAAAELYKALQAGRDRDMAATMERLDEYRTHNQQFCKRVYDYLSIIFVAQVSSELVHHVTFAHLRQVQNAARRLRWSRQEK